MEPTDVILHHAMPIIRILWKTPYATSETTTSTIDHSYAFLPVGNCGMYSFSVALYTQFTSTCSGNRFPAEQDLMNHQQHCH